MKKRIRTIALIGVFIVVFCSLFSFGCNANQKIKAKAMQYHDAMLSCCDYLDGYVNLVEKYVNIGMSYSLACSMASDFYDDEIETYNDNYVLAMQYYDELVEVTDDEKILETAYDIGYSLDKYSSVVNESSSYSSFSFNSEFWEETLRGHLEELKTLLK